MGNRIKYKIFVGLVTCLAQFARVSVRTDARVVGLVAGGEARGPVLTRRGVTRAPRVLAQRAGLPRAALAAERGWKVSNR